MTSDHRCLNRMKLKRTALFLIILFFSVYGRDAFGGKLYKWVDRDGFVHYSDRMPKNSGRLKELVQEEELKDIPPLKPQRD
ncbi:DUF4124 domain-containing protein, partial [Thermodesulfobacteriota bacterium]